MNEPDAAGSKRQPSPDVLEPPERSGASSTRAPPRAIEGTVDTPGSIEATQRTHRFNAANGTLLLVQPSRALPLVDVELTFRTGALSDPKGLEGLTRLTARMLRRGTRKRTALAIDETIDELGARLGIETGTTRVSFNGTVLARNLEPFVALLGELITQPAFRASELASLKRQTLADLVESCDHDQVLAARHFRRYLFPGHPLGRSAAGSLTSVRAIRRAHLLDHYRAHFVAHNLMVGFAGAVSASRARELLDRHLGRIRSGPRPRQLPRRPSVARGRRVLIVDKPERTQTQVIIGTLGVRAHDRDALALDVANTVFGGTFTSRLTNEVRSKRGWSYGASSSFGHARHRDAWSMWTFPATRDAVACIKMQLRLLERWVDKGISARELRFAQDYLAKSHAFDIDTPGKRLEEALEIELLGLPRNFGRTYVRRIREVTRSQANRALASHLSYRDLTIVVVATADELRDKLASLPGVGKLEVVPFDRV
ncbi:MAG: insulinase family protein [Proteobacteria bacterium]|nr:insulinase family protein [Pseudomonadota bacterium]